MVSYQYRVYGLRVDSEIEIPELITDIKGDPDVKIKLGDVPITLTKSNSKSVFYQAIKNKFIFRMEQVGAFQVSKGSEITIEIFPNAAPELMRVFLLGSVFGALLHQRGILALHGSAIDTKDGALVITGQSSSGKSTLAASLTRKGYPFVSDDISALHQDEKGFNVHHGIPQIKLWKDVLNKLGIDEGLKQIRPSVEKYRRVVLNGFVLQPKKVTRIIVLSSKNTNGIEIKELRGVKKFEPLKENTYRYEFINALQVSDQHFKSIMDLANSAKIFHVQRPSSPLMIEELTDAVVDKIIKSRS
jgi:hypothetical protein